MALQAPTSFSVTSTSSSQVFLSPSSSSTSRFVVVRVPNLTSSFRSREALKIAQPNTTRCNGHGGGGAFGAQMNIFERFARVIRSYANAILTNFEDPQKILEQAVTEMNDDINKMRHAAAQVLASQKQLEKTYKDAEKAADNWYRRAKLAVENGKEDLAREALKRRKSYTDTAKSLKTQLDQQKAVAEALVSNTQLLENKLQEARSKKQILQTCAQSAEAANKLREMLVDVNASNAFAAFDKMEEKVLAMEAQVEALNQLTSDDLERTFATLESCTVDDDLAGLRRDVFGSSKRGELPPGRTAVASSTTFPYKDPEIEEEFHKLKRQTREF